MTDEPDLINHPPHYRGNPAGIECIDVTEHMNFNLGNAVKYIWRCDAKGDPIENLSKARWYIEREIQRREWQEEQKGCQIVQEFKEAHDPPVDVMALAGQLAEAESEVARLRHEREGCP